MTAVAELHAFAWPLPTGAKCRDLGSTLWQAGCLITLYGFVATSLGGNLVEEQQPGVCALLNKFPHQKRWQTKDGGAYCCIGHTRIFQRLGEFNFVGSRIS